jgi:hypothetical protein
MSFVALLLAASFASFSQGKTLVSVNELKPKPGMGLEFESAWKAHNAKFHSGPDKRNVFEILSGPRTGSFLVVEGDMSYADLDIDKPGTADHKADVQKNLSPRLDPSAGRSFYRFADTLSYNPTNTEKAVLTITKLKVGKFGDYSAVLKKVQQVNAERKWPGSTSAYVQLWAGSSPTIVTVRNLKDGFKELEMGYYPGFGPNSFPEAYTKTFGADGWAQYLKATTELVDSQEQYIVKWRKDMSSK